MIFRILPCILTLLIFLPGCSSLSSLSYVENRYYKQKEIEIIDNIALSIDFRRGYDSKIDLNYFYAAGKFSPSEYSSRQNMLVQSLKAYKPEDCLGVYKKAYEVEATSLLYLDEFKKNKDWDNYIYLEKYLIPETKFFVSIFESSMMRAHPSTVMNLDDLKKQISARAKNKLEEKRRQAEEAEESESGN